MPAISFQRRVEILYPLVLQARYKKKRYAIFFSEDSFCHRNCYLHNVERNCSIQVGLELKPMPTSRPALNFLYWLELEHPEVETLTGLCEETLIQLIDEFENRNIDNVRVSKITRSYLSRIFSEETRIRNLSRIYSMENALAVLDFEKWIQEQHFQGSIFNEERVSFTITRYLSLKGNKSLYAYIRSMNALHYARMFNDFIEILLKAGVKIESSNDEHDYSRFASMTGRNDESSVNRVETAGEKPQRATICCCSAERGGRCRCTNPGQTRWSE